MAFRFAQTQLSTTAGYLTGAGSSGYFLEPSGPDLEWSGFDRRIPEGDYNVYEFTRARGTKVPGLYNQDVPAGREILMHSGNKPSQTSGCLLPGSSCSRNWVSNSKNTFTTLNNWINKVGHENVHFKILNVF